jgi:tetratricopeptide (TPR) repeat protein
MGYTVAWDTERKTNEAYMTAAGQNGIPCSYLVDRNGVIAYIGHPINLEEPLKQVVDGTFDMNKAKREYAKSREAEAKMAPLQKKFGEAMQAQNWAAAQEIAGEIAELDAAAGAQMHNFVAWTIVDPDGDVKDKNLDVALSAAERAAELSKSKDAAILDTLALVHFLKGNTAKAIEIQTKAVELAPAAMKGELQGRLDEFKAKK